MRIALYHNLPSGGAKRVVFEHTRRLRQRGHEVLVFEPQTADQGFLDVAAVATERHLLPYEWRPPELRRGLARLPQAVRNLRLMRDNYCRLAALQGQLAEQLAARPVDLVYVHHDLFETAPSLLRYTGLPTVYFCQEPHRPLYECPLAEGQAVESPPPSAQQLWSRARAVSPLTAYIHAYRMLNERTNTRAARLVLANSAYSAESLLRAHGRPARFCRLGVDHEFFTPGDAARADYVLSVGGLHPAKGFRFLLRALALVPEAARPPLVLVADRAEPGELEQLQALAAGLGVALTVRLRVSEDQLRDLYRRARLMLYAPYLEPLGLVALEAMACGTPVLGVKEGGVRETVVEGVSGWLAERDEALYAARLQDLLARPEAVAALADSSVAHVRAQWTWEHSVEHLLRLFAEVVPNA